MKNISEISVQSSFWGQSRIGQWLIVIAVFILGLALRFYDLTDPPLEAPVRPLISLIRARGMYYEMVPSANPEHNQAGIDLYRFAGDLEPPISERIVALAYWVAGGEYIWIPRVFAILYWMVGGGVLFFLSRRLSTFDGAVAVLAFYLVVPFGVYISRRFQPDSFMVMWVLISALALFVWAEKQDWKTSIVTGLICGITVLVKISGVYYIVAMALAIVLISQPLSQAIKNLKIWLMAILMIIPSALYYLMMIGNTSAGYFLFWNVSYAHLLKEPWFYVRWLEMIQTLIGLIITFVSMAGVTILPSKGRFLVSGLWLGYILFGISFPYQIHTHDYYSLMLLPIVALSLSPIASIFFSRLTPQPRIWKIIFVGIALLALAYPSWDVRVTLTRDESRSDWSAWTKIGATIPKGNVIALTDDYGLKIEYFGWRSVATWPMTYDLYATSLRDGQSVKIDYAALFLEKTQGMDYFLVTSGQQLDEQPDLKSILETYPIYDQGDGYITYDLRP